jgi:hypothetical protein
MQQIGYACRGTKEKQRQQGEDDMAASKLRKTSQRISTVAAVFATLAPLTPIDLAQAAPLVPSAIQAQGNDSLIEVRAFAARGRSVHVGPRGGAVVRSGAVVRGPAGGVAVRRGAVVAGPRGNVGVVRRTTVVAPGRWARPGRYRWPVGGAIAAGAALGFVAAATAAAWAGPPPSDGLCWYYTDPSRTQGFWDYCPQ